MKKLKTSKIFLIAATMLGLWRAAVAGDIDFNMSTADGSTATTFQDVNGSTRVVVTSAGNVGIRKINPSQPLDVSGNIQFSQALMPGGLPGASGQFLQSVGAGSPPAWVNLPAGGTSALGIFQNGVQVSSPTAQMNFLNPLKATLVGAAATQVTLDCSSATCLGSAVNGINQLVQLNGTGALPAVSGANLTNLPAGNLVGTVANSAIDVSSVTKQGNTFNAANKLVQLDGSGKYPALDGSAIANVTASSVTNSAIDGSSVTKQGNNFNGAGKLVQLNGTGALPAVSGANLTNLPAGNLVGTVANSAIDVSSVTKQGNTFNAANKLVQLDGSARLPAVDGGNLTNITVISVPNSAIDASSVTKQGNSFNTANKLVQLSGAGALPALSGANLTSLPAGNLVGTVPPTSLGNAILNQSSLQSGAVVNLSSGTLSMLNTTTLKFNDGTTQTTASAAGNASNLISGTVPNARLDGSSVTLQGNAFNTANRLVQLNGSGLIPNTVIDASVVTKQGNAFNGANQLVQLNGAGALPAVSGANLTNLPNSANVTRVSTNYAMTSTNRLVIGQRSGSDFSIVLPAASNAGMIVHVCRTDGQSGNVYVVPLSGNVLVDPNSSETASSFNLRYQYNCVTWIADGSAAWLALSQL
jgi:hypothetical protein